LSRFALAALLLAACGTPEPQVPAPVPVPAAATPAKAPPAPSARPIPEMTKVPEGELTPTPSGLKYKDLVVGTGAGVEPGGIAVVEYTGWLTDGTMFDSSYKRPDPFKFPLGKGRVIKGWDEGVATMKVGGKRQLVVPADLAYGDKVKPNIPAGSTLVFDVELIAAQPPRVAPEKPQAVAAKEFTKTPSGLLVHDFVVGTGPSPAPGARVTVDYTGWLENGTQFDSSMERPSGITFPLGQGQVIKGWDEGIATMKEGGSRQLKIPSDLAYGPKGRPPVIPENATLIFEVTLVDAGEGK
jgi:peptidylprolyl isomerase